jgi:hypothetical protein
MKLDFEFEGVPVEVEFAYEPSDSGDFYSPPTYSFVEIEDIKVKGISIYDLIGDNQLSKLEEELLKYCEDK